MKTLEEIYDELTQLTPEEIARRVNKAEEIISKREYDQHWLSQQLTQAERKLSKL